MDLMSTTQLLGSLGEFIGSIAVLVTLIYLAAQIRQNTATMKNQAEQESSKWWYDLNREMTYAPEILEIFQQGLKDIEQMSDADRRRFVWFVASTFYRIMGFHKAWISGSCEHFSNTKPWILGGKLDSSTAAMNSSPTWKAYEIPLRRSGNTWILHERSIQRRTPALA